MQLEKMSRVTFITFLSLQTIDDHLALYFVSSDIASTNNAFINIKPDKYDICTIKVTTILGLIPLLVNCGMHKRNVS